MGAVRTLVLLCTLVTMSYTNRVELHVHLDGSIPVETLLRVAVKRNMSLPGVGVPRSVDDVWTVLKAAQPLWHRFDVVNDIIGGDAASLRQVAADFVARQAAQGVSYTEVRYDPVRAAVSNYANVSITLEQAVEAISDGLRQACAFHRVKVYSLLCAMRGKPAAACFQTAALASKMRSQEVGGVVGMDLAGDERDYNNSQYVPCLQHAKQVLGLNTTVHAGEAGSITANDVLTAIEEMGVDRIGHGYAGALDASIASVMKRSGVHLEACPRSAELEAGLIGLQAFKSQGLNFGLNEDDPSQAFGNCSMGCIEEIVKSKCGFDSTDITRAYNNAAASRFGALSWHYE